jgi:hypothetical protein
VSSIASPLFSWFAGAIPANSMRVCAASREAVSIAVGLPTRLSIVGFGDTSRCLLLGTVVHPGCASMCVLGAARMLAVCALAAIRSRVISSWCRWYAWHSRLCHAAWLFPHAAQDNLVSLHRDVMWAPAHRPHLACFTHAFPICPHWWQL